MHRAKSCRWPLRRLNDPEIGGRRGILCDGPRHRRALRACVAPDQSLRGLIGVLFYSANACARRAVPGRAVPVFACPHILSKQS